MSRQAEWSANQYSKYMSTILWPSMHARVLLHIKQDLAFVSFSGSELRKGLSVRFLINNVSARRSVRPVTVRSSPQALLAVEGQDIFIVYVCQ